MSTFQSAEQSSDIEAGAGLRAGARTSARRVWDLLELRLQIMHFLPKSQLPIMMRVDKQGMEIVARELYGEMDYNRAQGISSDDPVGRICILQRVWAQLTLKARLRMYNAAVTVISGRYEDDWMRVSPEDREALGWRELEFETNDELESYEGDWQGWLRSYHPEMVDRLVLPLLERFPSLRMIEFGEEHKPMYSTSTWVVHLPQRDRRANTPLIHHSSPPSPAWLDAEGLPLLGHIDHYNYHSFYVGKDTPPSVLPPAQAPFAPFSIHEQFDLHIGIDKSVPLHRRQALIRPWLVALRSATWLSDLYKGISAGPLPIDLSDLIYLYERQDSSGNGSRLESIEAPNILPYSLDDFQRFATVASASLTLLNLCGFPDGDRLCDEGLTKLSFQNLPSFFSIVSTSLKNLETLYISVSGAATAEITTQPMLVESALEMRGSIRVLRLLTVDFPSFPFNSLRFASTICTSNANIAVGPSSSCALLGWQLHSKYINYLRSLKQQNRLHLSTVNFPSLEVKLPLEVEELEYYSDGRPMTRSKTMARKLAKGASQNERQATRNLLPSLSAYLTASRMGMDHLALISGPETTAQKLGEARAALNSLGEVLQATKRIEQITRKAQSTELELRNYIELLEGLGGDI